MKKMKKNNKGFTLVELIVVIVILAILAAILVPTLLGYIDKAKKQQTLLNAKSALTAAQAELSRMYATGTDPADIDKNEVLKVADIADVCDGLEIGFDISYEDAAKVTDATKTKKLHQAYTITYVKYKEKGKEAIYYKATTAADGSVTSTWDAPSSSTAAAKVVIKAFSN